MKKLAAVLFCVGLCISIAVLIPQVGTTNPNVDDTGCLVSGCHDAGFGEDSFHGVHGALGCDSCHETESGGGAVPSSSCVECHPVGDPGACNLVNLHEDAGASCLECHEACAVIPPGDCSIDVLQESVLRSRWLPTVALITIEGTDTGWVQAAIRNNFEIEYIPTLSRDLFVLPGTLPFLVEDSQTIRQLIILLPSWFTACCFDGSVEIMTVEVCNTQEGLECCDSDEVAITMLPLFLDQQ